MMPIRPFPPVRVQQGRRGTSIRTSSGPRERGGHYGVTLQTIRTAGRISTGMRTRTGSGQVPHLASLPRIGPSTQPLYDNTLEMLDIRSFWPRLRKDSIFTGLRAMGSLAVSLLGAWETTELIERGYILFPIITGILWVGTTLATTQLLMEKQKKKS